MNDPVWVIAGGTGFLGRAILQKIRDTNVKIVVLTRDVAVAARRAVQVSNDDWKGVINGVSPHPVKNKDFLKSLRLAYGMRWGLPQPAFILKIGALLIGTEAELLLSGRRVVSKILEEKKFRFNYPLLEDALEQLIQE